ncbi:MAG: amidohydrolase family protein [Gemmatimonadaceae bacterium]
MRPTSLLAILSLIAAPLPGQAPQTIAFTHATVIPMDRERSLSDHSVIVRGDRILDVGPSSRVRVPAGATEVNAQGKFLIPGLAEMHAHVPGAPNDFVERVLALYVLNGVTTVRGMLGAPAHLELRARAARGEILSPTIYTTGPSFNGSSVTSAEVGMQMVRDQKAAGYDLLKIHPGIARAAYDSIAATAARLGIPFAGHVPAAVGVRRALAVKQASIDHLDGYVEALVAADKRAGAPASAWFGSNLTGLLDWSLLPDLARATLANGVWVVPTETIMESQSAGNLEEMLAWPEMRYWPQNQRTAWTNSLRNFRAQGGWTPESGQAFVDVRRRLIRELHSAGVKFLLGSDAPQVWNVPGFSVHREMQQLAAAGLTPYQILTSGTRNVAEYFAAVREFGTIEAGKRADLILLDADPLRDIANTAAIAGVMLRGRWIGKDEIGRRLASLHVP